MRRLPRLTYGGLIALLALMCILALVSLPLLTRAREASRRTSCANNLKQMGLVFKMYAGESKHGRWPPLSPIPDNWMVDIRTVYPDYLADLSILICPGSPFATERTFRTYQGSVPGELHPGCVSSLFYIYTGYTVLSDEQALALFQGYEQDPAAVIAGQSLELEVPLWENSGRIHGTGESGIPVLWDRPFACEEAFAHRHPIGGNVLHMDGHVAFVPYSYYNNSNYFPMTRLCAETFGGVLPTMPSFCYGD
jgi:prepilin-type processing-associated H-X9-DG protein